MLQVTFFAWATPYPCSRWRFWMGKYLFSWWSWTATDKGRFLFIRIIDQSINPLMKFLISSVTKEWNFWVVRVQHWAEWMTTSGRRQDLINIYIDVVHNFFHKYYVITDCWFFLCEIKWSLGFNQGLQGDKKWYVRIRLLHKVFTLACFWVFVTTLYLWRG